MAAITNITFANPNVTITGTDNGNAVNMTIPDHGYFNNAAGAILANGAAPATDVYMILTVPIQVIQDMSDTQQNQTVKQDANRKLHDSFFNMIDTYFRDLNNGKSFESFLAIHETQSLDPTKYTSWLKGKKTVITAITNFANPADIRKLLETIKIANYRLIDQNDLTILTLDVQTAIPVATTLVARTTLSQDELDLLICMDRILPNMARLLSKTITTAQKRELTTEIFKIQRLDPKLYTNLSQYTKPSSGGSMKKQRRIKSGIPKYRSKKQRKPTRK
jgi:hypothetical protein